MKKRGPQVLGGILSHEGNSIDSEKFLQHAFQQLFCVQPHFITTEMTLPTFFLHTKHQRTWNKKVYWQMLSVRIDIAFSAVGPLFYKVTRPYWYLVQSSVHYLHFYKYVGKLFDSLKVWQDDLSTMFGLTLQCLKKSLKWRAVIPPHFRTLMLPKKRAYVMYSNFCAQVLLK